MSTNKLTLPVAGFTGGLNTEASVLNVQPTELMSGTVNVELSTNGSIRRRKGADFIGVSDAGGSLQTIRTATEGAELNQESPAGFVVRLTAPNGDLVERLVMDIDNEFRIYKVEHNALENIDAPLQTITRANNSDDLQMRYNMQFAASGDRLYFAGRHCKPGYLSVNADNSTLDIAYYDVLIRDPDAVVVNTRRQYGSKGYECIKAHTSATATNRPGTGSNWEEFWFQLDGPPGSMTAWANATAYTTTFIKRYDSFANTTATDTYPTTVETHANRVFLSGDPKHPNELLFSRVITKDTDIPKFHQYADPYDATDPDLVADDGGRVLLQGAGLIKQLLSVGTSIFIGTVYGIHQMTGPDGIFTTTNFSNYKVLTDGIDSPYGMVRVDSEVVVFGQDSIWRSSVDLSGVSLTSGQATFVSVSIDRVDSDYSAIPQRSKAAAVALFNPSERRVYYYHNSSVRNFDTAHNEYTQPGYFTDVLVMDTDFKSQAEVLQQDAPKRRLTQGAFFRYSYNDGAMDGLPYIAMPILSRDVPADDNPVVDQLGDPVLDQTGEQVYSAGEASAKYVNLFIVMRRSVSAGTATIQSAFATNNTSNISDWVTDATYTIAEDAYAYVGVQTMDNPLPNKAATYLYFVFKKVETGTLTAGNVDTNPGSCLVATAWDFANLEANPKHSSFREVYYPYRNSYSLAGAGDDGFSHVWYKHRVRGRGNALQIVFKSDGTKDFDLVGWTQNFYGVS